MAEEITVPTLGESVAEATVATWLKQVGDSVAMDEPLVELETDKVNIEVNATAAGVLSEISANEGDDVEVGALLGMIDTDGAAAAPAKSDDKPAASNGAAASAPAAQSADTSKDHGPAVRKMLAENNVDAASIPATGKDGRLTKGDVQKAIASGSAAPAQQAPAQGSARTEERVRMSKLRQVIASRLKDAQNTAAMLTTFNEVDMSALMQLRSEYKERFEKRHDVRLGFMSFFIKAAVAGLRDFPAVNAQIDGKEVVYRNYYDIGVAVSSPNGLVVPVLRDCQDKGFADIEVGIADFGKRAQTGDLKIDEMTGGTFTISNGGVFGSLMSTPILNPPQSAILGMHAIKQRPVAIDGKVEIRPMMYLALSYDHRIIDGREAVSFLVRLKEGIEDPRRLLMDV
ncbi:MAG: 2-oxoglutarate dehydrogenase complex dihydrolipoyllysine-residue succinyltransferase [Alphaproteobacteria bacterium]